MKNQLLIASIILVLISCDPVAEMEANIENLTTQTLIIEFISSEVVLSKFLHIPPSQISLFQEGFDIGSVFLEPSLIEYDSVVVKNISGEVLRVYKDADAGKNIYKVGEYWKSKEPSKRFFKYEYEIMEEDLEEHYL